MLLYMRIWSFFNAVERFTMSALRTDFYNVCKALIITLPVMRASTLSLLFQTDLSSAPPATTSRRLRKRISSISTRRNKVSECTLFKLSSSCSFGKHLYITTTNITKTPFLLYKYIFYSVDLLSLSCGVLYVHCSINNYFQNEKYIILEADDSLVNN